MEEEEERNDTHGIAMRRRGSRASLRGASSGRRRPCRAPPVRLSSPTGIASVGGGEARLGWGGEEGGGTAQRGWRNTPKDPRLRRAARLNKAPADLCREDRGKVGPSLDGIPPRHAPLLSSLSLLSFFTARRFFPPRPPPPLSHSLSLPASSFLSISLRFFLFPSTFLPRLRKWARHYLRHKKRYQTCTLHVNNCGDFSRLYS
jgi:hypothetical protein